MEMKDVLKNANQLADRFHQDRISESCLSQLFQYLLSQQRSISDVEAKKNFLKLLQEMPSSGFAGRGGLGSQYRKTRQILEGREMATRPIDLPLDTLTEVFGWAVRLVKYREGLQRRTRF